MAIPTLTIYSVSADLTTLDAILNGVAMLCDQNALIWGFALLVALWRLLQSSTVAVMKSPTGQGAAVLSSGAMNALMPFILAMTLTNSMLKGTVQLESTINGALTEVSNVPLAISIIPAAGSILSQNINEVVSTAFSNVDSEYPTVSATANGFLNPLKILLTSRTAISRLGGIDSEVRSVLTDCVGPDSGVNYAAIETAVQNAGNTGATTSTSIEVNGQNPTAVGALLYQASLNTTGKVDGTAFASATTSNANQAMSCSDAANQVATDITTELNSVEFTRVIQGAVNGMDTPIPGADYSYNTVAAQYDAVSRANTLGSVFTGGTGQSNAEFMNLLFSEMVESDLNCLKATSDSMVQCQATALQASEVERNNLSAAASEVPMLRYAGSFGNYLIALLIGLGPVIVMFMMFAGVDSGKSIKTVAHLIVWPLLVVNVGAELVNGMLVIDVANYLTSLRQGGWISQASSLAAYKQLSLQIGVGSHIMASLPVLMSMIFGLGESSALTSVASTIAPKSKDVADNMAVQPEASQPMFQNSSVGSATQFAHGAGNVKFSGSTDAVSTSMSFGNSAREAARTLAQSETRSQSITQGQQNLGEWRQAFSSGNFSRVTGDQSIGQAVAQEFRASQQARKNEHVNNSVAATRTNSNEASAGAGASFGAGAGGEEGGGLSANVGAHGDASTRASDSLQGTDSRGGSKDYNDSVDLAKALTKTLSRYQNTSAGKQASADLSRSLSTQESYQKTLSDVQSSSDSATQGVRDSSSFVNMSAQMGANEIVWQNQRNPDYAAFQVISGHQFESNPTTAPYLERAAADAASGATGRVVGDSAGQEAVNRHRAAVMLAQDQTAKPEDRVAATKYLTDEAAAMQHMRFDPTNSAPMPMSIASPGDSTGVNSSAIRRAAGGPATLPSPAGVPAVPAMQSGPSPVTEPSAATASPMSVSHNGAAPTPAAYAPTTGSTPSAGSPEPATRANAAPAAAVTTSASQHSPTATPVAAPAVHPARSAGTATSGPESHAATRAPGAASAVPLQHAAHDTPAGQGAAPQPAARVAAVPTAPEHAVRPQHAGQAPQPPATAAPNFDLDPAFERSVTAQVASEHDGIHKDVTGAERVAQDAGLDKNGHGTVIRTAANVADNVVDVARPAGSSSRTRLGNTDAPASGQSGFDDPPKSGVPR